MLPGLPDVPVHEDFKGWAAEMIRGGGGGEAPSGRRHSNDGVALKKVVSDPHYNG